MKIRIAAIACIALTAGCAGARWKAWDRKFTPTASSKTLRFEPDVEGLRKCVISMGGSAHELGGNYLLVIRAGEDGGARLEVEIRTPYMFGLGDHNGAYAGTTTLDAGTYKSLLEELAAACRLRAQRYPAVCGPEVFIDTPDGRRLSLTARELPRGTPDAAPADDPDALPVFVSAQEYTPPWYRAISLQAHETLDSAINSTEPHQYYEKRPVNIPKPAKLERWEYPAAQEGQRPPTAPPAGKGFYLTDELLEGKGRIAGQPGHVLDLYIRAAHGPLPVKELASLWKRSDDPIRLTVLEHLLKYGDRDLREFAGRRLGERIVAARVAEGTSRGYLNNLAWTMLGGLGDAAARGDRWPCDLGLWLLEQDIDKNDGAHICFRGKSIILLNYMHTDKERVGKALLARLDCEMRCDIDLVMESVAEMAPPGAARALGRFVRPPVGPDGKVNRSKSDIALVRLGDRKAIARCIQRMEKEQEGLDFYHRLPFFGALRFIPSERLLKSDFAEVPAGDREALADYLVDRAEAGEFMKATPFSRLASPRFAKWLLDALKSGEYPRTYLLDQLAWQTEPSAVEKLIGLLGENDEDAMSAVSGRWSPRFFPEAEADGGEYYLTSEQVKEADWDAVRRAARDGSLHYYSFASFPHQSWPIKNYLGESTMK